MKIGDIVILPGTGPLWHIVPAQPHDGVDVILNPGVTIIDGFYHSPEGKTICLLQDETGYTDEVLATELVACAAWRKK